MVQKLTYTYLHALYTLVFHCHPMSPDLTVVGFTLPDVSRPPVLPNEVLPIYFLKLIHRVLLLF